MFGKRKVLGVEIGRDDIRTVELKLSGKGDYFITGYAHKELTREILDEGAVVDEDAFSEAFVQLCRENKYTAKYAIFGIDNQTTILRFAAFPKTDAAKQRGLIKLNAQEHIPVPVSELELDYVQLAEDKGEDGDIINVLICAVRKKTIQRILGISKDAGVSAMMITPSQIAYANTVLSRVKSDDFMAVKIGKKSIYHIVFENRQIAFMRNVNADPESFSVLGTLARGEKLLPDEIESIGSDIARSVDATINYYRLRTKKEINHIVFTGAMLLRQHVSAAFERDLEAEIEFIRLFEPDVRRGSSPPEDYDSCISLALSKTK